MATPATKKKYWRLFQRFVVFIFRAFRMPPGQRYRLTGIRFTRPQLERLEAIWEHETWEKNDLARGGRAADRLPRGRDDADDGTDDNDDDDDENESEDGQADADDENEDEHREEEDEIAVTESSSTSQLLELIFQLSMIFSIQRFIDGQIASNLLIYFSGVLGFSVDGRRFLSAKHYTPYLSDLIYVQRLLFLEHALSFRPYLHLGISYRSRYR
jgi:hypothetical protein